MDHAVARRSPARTIAPDEIDPDAWRRRPIDGRWMVLAVGGLFLVYLSLLNRYWVPSGDGEIYTCIARSLARGQGLMFNGSRAAIEPPGWPIVLSLLMRITPEFWFLKLFQIACMTGSMALSFLIVRRWVSDRASAGIILLTGTLSVLYPLTFWMHTEAFFCLLGFGALLIGFRIRDGIAAKWEIGLMLVLLGYAAFTRWSGALYVLLLVPIMLSGFRFGEWPWLKAMLARADNAATRRRWTRRLGLVATTFLVAACVFVGTHRYLKATKLTHEQLIAMQNSGVMPDTNEPDSGTPTDTSTTQATSQPEGGPDDRVPSLGDQNWGRRGPVLEIIHRILIAGKWFAWLLWQPTRMGQSVALVDIAGMTAGWLTIGLLAIAMVERMFRHRDYFWVGLAAYTGGLCVLWDNPNARYFVPVAPFIVLGVFLGLRAIIECAAATTAAVWPGRVAYALGVAFVVAVVVSNVPLLAYEIRVFRAGDFYAHYEGGADQQLIEAALLINRSYRDEHLVGPIGLSERYDNMGRSKFSPFGKRALHLLCDLNVYGAPKNKSSRPTAEDTRKWGKKYGVTFYVYQMQWRPWRVWHFILPDWLQAKLDKTWSKTGNNRHTGGWELWTRNPATAGYKQVDLPRLDAKLEQAAYPTRVPGL